jgi:hypothetical protein
MVLVRVATSGWVNENLLKNFEVTDTADIDGSTWRTVRTYNKDVAAWIRSHPAWHRYEYGGDEHRYGSIFDVDEKLYTLLCLRWC